jgi:NhaA family Na+:H+ antiporter
VLIASAIASLLAAAVLLRRGRKIKNGDGADDA